MKHKKLCLILFLCTTKLLFAQKNKTIDIEFSNNSIKSAINKLEQKTNLSFYYIDEWVSSEKKTINQKFINKPINNILTTIFENTLLNFFIDGDKVILTQKIKIVPPNITVKGKNISKNKLVNELLLKQLPNEKLVKIGKISDPVKPFYTLRGKIIDYKNNTPIVGAIIVDAEQKYNATTGVNGAFKIKLPFGKNTIKIISSEHEDYSETIALLNNGKKDFFLDEKSSLLDEVIVNSKSLEKLRSTVTGVTFLKAESIKTIPQVLGERDLLKATLTLPGIKNTNESSQGVNVRGGQSDQNLFLLDNVTIYNPSHFLGIFSAVNPFVTKEINVYKGNIPSRYGGRVSSVFDIKLKDINLTELKGETSIGPVTGNVAVSTPIIKEKAGLMVGVRSTYSNWLLSLVDNQNIKRSKVNFYDGTLKYKHKINDKNSIGLLTYYSKDSYQIASDSINSYQNKLFSVNWNHKFNDNNSIKFQLSNSNYSFDTEFEGNEIERFNLDYELNEYSFKVLANSKIYDNHKLNYGLDSKLYKIQPGRIRPKGENSIVQPLDLANEKAIENSVFLSDNFEVSDDLAFDIGARYTHYTALGPSTQRIYDSNLPKSQSTIIENRVFKNNEFIKNEHAFSGYFASRYKFDNNLSLKVSVNRSNQFIHRLSNNISATPIDIWKLSDLNIKPISATQYSVGLYKILPFTSNTYKISLESYYKNFDNLLDYRTGADLILNPTLETDILQGKGKAYGVEFLLSKEKGDFNGWISYTYSKSLLKFQSPFLQNRINNENYFPANFDKPHDLNIVANYKLTKRYSFSANFTYQTGRPITYPTGRFNLSDSDFLLFSDRNQFRLPDYYRLDIGINIEGNHKNKKIAHSFWNISIYNVLGRDNVNSIFFRTQDGEVTGFQTSIFSLPIPTITYNLKF